MESDPPMRCSRCQTENREGRKFCASCGTPLARACECGYVNDATDRFCGGCGRPLEREAEAASPSEIDGDRRPVAIMFCDLVGYTRLSSKLDPEEVRALLEQFFGVIDSIVERYGGTIDKHIGDASMALFGAPRAYGDDALRAVRAGGRNPDPDPDETQGGLGPARSPCRPRHGRRRRKPGRQ